MSEMTHEEALEAVAGFMPGNPSDEDLTKFLRDYLGAREMVMLPVAATLEMYESAHKAGVCLDDAMACYEAMLAAAPDQLAPSP